MTFETWLQSRLVAYGYKIGVDGVIGPETTGALKDFQRKRKIRQTGVADKETISALRLEPSKSGKVRKTLEVPTEDMPPWMAEMWRRKGLHEARDNKTLTEWLRAGRLLGNPAKLPWCGDAVETCIVKTLPDEPVPNNPFWAQAWANFGVGVDPIVGSIGVIRWSSRAGHVGIVADASASRITLLGGNQSNAITLSSFPRSKFIAFRWPKTYPVKHYQPVTGKAGAGSHKGTR